MMRPGLPGGGGRERRFSCFIAVNTNKEGNVFTCACPVHRRGGGGEVGARGGRQIILTYGGESDH